MIDNNEKHRYRSHNLKLTFSFHKTCYFHAKLKKKMRMPIYLFFLCIFAFMKSIKWLIFLMFIVLIACHKTNEHKTVICIPVYGQSLALGVDAKRITNFDSLATFAEGRIVTENLDHHYGYFDFSATKQFLKKIMRQKHSYELSVYTMAEMIASHTGRDTLICIFPGGQDGTVIADLGKGTPPIKNS